MKSPPQEKFYLGLKPLQRSDPRDALEAVTGAQSALINRKTGQKQKETERDRKRQKEKERKGLWNL